MFKKGDRVYCMAYGWGKVVKEKTVASTSYPIAVNFDDGGDSCRWYTREGCLYMECGQQTLFHGVPTMGFIPPEPDRKPDWKKDQRIEVQFSKGNTWFRRYFSHWGEGGVCWVFNNGMTSFTAKGSCSTSPTTAYREFRDD